MFLGRERELAALNRRHRRDGLECIVIYGRRRVGKTALINEFCRGKRTIYFPALQASAQENLAALSRSIAQYLGMDAASAPVYQSFDAAFAQVTSIARQERVIFVIDEMPYLCASDPSIPSRLQHLLDHDWAQGGLFLILCGSSMGFMEREVLGEKSPLFGRRTAQIKVVPMEFWDAARFHPELPPEDNALVYAITGGVPHYINKLDVRGSVREALIENLFDTSAYLFEEPDNLMRQELRQPALYNTIISAIAEGASRANEIAAKSHMETSACSKYLRTLMGLGIVERVEPIVDASRRKVCYRIKDGLFRFWYRFVPKNMTMIAASRMEEAYDAAVGSYLHDFMGQAFEHMCRSWLVGKAGGLPFAIADVGEWWGAHPGLHKEVQLDIVATSTHPQGAKRDDRFLVGSCKYRNERVGVDELGLIRDYASTCIPAHARIWWYIFSKGGFTEGLQAEGEREDVALVTLRDLYGAS